MSLTRLGRIWRPGSPPWIAMASSPYPSVAVGLIACAVAWTSRLNQNVFYITLLLTADIFAQFITSSIRIRFILQGLFVFLLFYTPNPRPAMPSVIQSVTAPDDSRSIPPGGARGYRFILQGIRDRTGQCGAMPVGDIYIQGSRLDDASLHASNVVISQQKIIPFYNLSKMSARMEFPSGIPTELNVELVNDGAATMTVRYGPEIAGKTIYNEAVYMIFRSDKCVIVAHSTPVSAPQ